MNFIKQILYELHNQKIMTWVSISGTALAIFLIMAMVMADRIVNVSISPEAEAVILKGMALQTENRYIDMREFYNALKHTPEVAKDLNGSVSVSLPLSVQDEESYGKLIARLNSDAEKNSDRVWEVVVIAVVILIVLIVIIAGGF